MDASVTGRRPRRGFTLIEMLAVVVIIGILASLITVAALNAIRTAKEAKIKLEIDQLAMALSEYKNQYGDYPPDSLTDTAAVERHLARAFPRCDAKELRNSLPNLTPASALVFWLGGMPDANGVPDGFNADPRNPFAPGGARTKPLFEFAPDRLATDANGSLAYFPETSAPAGPEACRIQISNTMRPQQYPLLDKVPGRSRIGRNQGPFVSNKLIQQAALPGIGLSGQNDPDAVPNQASVAAGGQESPRLPRYPLDRLQTAIAVVGRKIVFRKIYIGLDACHHIQEVI